MGWPAPSLSTLFFNELSGMSQLDETSLKLWFNLSVQRIESLLSCITQIIIKQDLKVNVNFVTKTKRIKKEKTIVSFVFV